MVCKSPAAARKIKSGEKLTNCLCGESLTSGELADRLSGYCGRMERSEPPAVVYGEDPVVAAAMNQEYRQALKAAIAENTEPEVFQELRWTKAFYPALQDQSILRAHR